MTPAHAVRVKETDTVLVATTIQALVTAACRNFMRQAADTLKTESPYGFARCHLLDSFRSSVPQCPAPVAMVSPRFSS